MSSSLVVYTKSLLVGGFIIGLGYGLMKITTPNTEDWYAKLSPDLKEQINSPETRKKNELIMEVLRRTAKSDKPVYDPRQIMEEIKKEEEMKKR
ncbi:hypothetical protein RclHR1_00980017 [Rhizophagus clarus]|uniref:Cytochrome b mRNA-processing protein 4 n=1 Tax=Rhizophagus clarus TaxID=94130 RepID=A0A2Z6SIC7_9GLOM|nr:hypothetical protein RclHR1_00980017 [Rhizophagus clarus]GES81168.1 assembly factor CBP4-like [Rhizophagus clarus]